MNNSIYVPSNTIQVFGLGIFCGAVAGTLEEIPEWELVQGEDGTKLVSEDQFSSMTVFLIPASEPVEGEITCVLWIAGNYYTPCTSYLYETDSKTEMVNFT